MDEESCIVEDVQSLDTPLAPILINFDYGHHPDKHARGLKCDMYVEPENPLKRKIVVKKHEQTFVGDLQPMENPLGHSLLLVRNKTTNKARVILTRSCNLIDVSKAEDIVSRKRNKSSSTNLSEGEKLSANNFLRQNFGSKKSKRVSEMGLRMNVNVSGKEDEIKETVSSIDVKLNEINHKDGNEELLKLIPPCNRESITVSDVYQMDDIVNAKERETLKPFALFLMENGLTKADEKNSYFLYSHYTLLEENPDVDKVILLIYANTLFKFYNLSAGDLKKKNLLTIIHPSSRLIALRVLNDFTLLTKAGRTRPSFYKDKLVCYLIVIILLFNNYRINLETLSSCLKGFSYKKLLQLARVVGLVPVTSFSSAKTFVLKLPLPSLPKPRIPKKRASSL